MSEKLLSHYEKELAFIHQSASEFARRHPGTAANLRLRDDSVDDPLVARLLSGFAYLSARTQQKLADDFPELTDALLETLYPHYLRPIPSMSIVQFIAEDDLDEVVRLPRHTPLETTAFQGQTCRFQTCYPADIVPVAVDTATLLPRPFIAPGSNDIPGAGAVLKLSLKTLTGKQSLTGLQLQQLRFFLAGQSQQVYPLYDLLLTKTLRIVIAHSEADPYPVVLDRDALQPVGFESEEALLPYPHHSFTGYRLLTEYFAFPEKFHFLDLTGLAAAIDQRYQQQLNIYFYLQESHSELEHQLSSSMFQLGCTPAINLFPQRADPVPLTHTQYEYTVVPDSRRTDAMEIYSIDTVGAVDPSGNYITCRPFYGVQHADGEQQAAFWFARRRTVVEGEHRNEQASEVDLTLVDLNFDPHRADQRTLDIRLTCSNRNQPKKLPTHNGQPHFHIVDGSAPAKRIASVVAPTPTLRPPLRERGYWRLISHLNLNHLSLSNGPGACASLKEILRLYDFRDSAATRNLIESIRLLRTKPITAPIQIEDTVAICRGTEVQLELDPVMLTGSSPLLFASVLERFFGLYCSINSFTRLVATLSGRDGELRRWPPRAGEKALL